MTLKIAVLIKSVPDQDCYDEVTIDPISKRLNREGIPSVISSLDMHALELALSLKEKHGATITVFTMAPPDGKDQLFKALGFGADEAYLLTDRKVGGADSLATAYTLSVLLKHVGDFDLILAGNHSDDGATSHVPSQIGELMGISHMMNVVGFEMTDDKIARVKQNVEAGNSIYKVTLPAVIAVERTINTVRYPNVMETLKAKTKPLNILTAADLTKLDEEKIGLRGSTTQAGELITMEFNREGELIEGSEEEIAEQIIEKINSVI